MMNIKSKNEEFALFNQLSDEWWNENGKFKILHQIKSHRMSYILDQINDRNIRNLKILDAREKVLAFMSEIDIFVKEEKIDNTIPVGDRSGEVVEPLLKNQWFLDVKEMANKSSSAVEKGEVEFKPKFWENTFFEWMNKILSLIHI